MTTENVTILPENGWTELANNTEGSFTLNNGQHCIFSGTPPEDLIGHRVTGKSISYINGSGEAVYVKVSRTCVAINNIIGGVPPVGGLTFLSVQEIPSARLFGATSHQFDLTAPAETDGVVFVALVQKKNQGINVTDIQVDGGVSVGASHSIGSNPLGRENQLAVFEDKSFGAGAHTIDITNIDGMEGTTIIAVYYKNYTGLTGNFAEDVLTGTQLTSQVTVGDSNWAVTAGNRGLNVVFAGGLSNLLTEVPTAEYSDGIAEYGTTDTADNQYNGKFKTAVDLDFASNTSDTSWIIDWDSAGVDAEVLVLCGELSNT